MQYTDLAIDYVGTSFDSSALVFEDSSVIAMATEIESTWSVFSVKASTVATASSVVS